MLAGPKATCSTGSQCVIWFPGIFFFPLFKSHLPSRLCLIAVSSVGSCVIFPVELVFFFNSQLLHLWLFHDTHKFYLALYLPILHIISRPYWVVGLRGPSLGLIHWVLYIVHTQQTCID